MRNHTFIRFVGASTQKFGPYLIANSWTLIPLSLSFLVIAIAFNVTTIPVDCADRALANWVICAPDASHNPIPKLSEKNMARVFPDTASHLETIRKNADAELFQTVGVAAREASARLSWAATQGLLVFAGLLTIAVCAWLLVKSMRSRHMVSVSAAKDPKSYFTRFLLVALAGLTAAYFIVVGITSLCFGNSILTPWTMLERAFAGERLFNDGLLAAIGINVNHMKFFLGASAVAVLASTIMVSILVSSTLFQGLNDSRLRNNPQLDLNGEYRRYLGESFSLLRAAIYLGAALLVAILANFSAQYNWAVVLIDPDASHTLQDANKYLGAFGQTVTSNAGLAFTLFLATLYWPAAAILRTRAREYFWARNTGKTVKDADDFLSNNGLSLGLSTSYVDFLAVLAPTAVGTVGALFKILG